MAHCLREPRVQLKGAVSQIFGERTLLGNAEREHFDIGDEISSTARSAETENCLPPRLVPEACAQASAELTTPVGTFVDIVPIGM